MGRTSMWSVLGHFIDDQSDNDMFFRGIKDYVNSKLIKVEIHLNLLMSMMFREFWRLNYRAPEEKLCAGSNTDQRERSLALHMGGSAWDWYQPTNNFSNATYQFDEDSLRGVGEVSKLSSVFIEKFHHKSVEYHIAVIQCKNSFKKK